jgi:putative addiction module component (TIGR02574 family)
MPIAHFIQYACFRNQDIFVPYNMPINIDEIKKLPDQEKLKLIDELLESIDNSVIDNYLCEAETETDNILRERWEEYKSGKMKFDSWENAYARLREKAKHWQNKNPDGL